MLLPAVITLELQHDVRFCGGVPRHPVQSVSRTDECQPRPWSLRVPQGDAVAPADDRPRPAGRPREVVRPTIGCDGSGELPIIPDPEGDQGLVLILVAAHPSEGAAPGSAEIAGRSGRS